jgi:hypothetical protein
MDAIVKKLQVKEGDSLEIISKPRGVTLRSIKGTGRRVVLLFAKNKKDLKVSGYKKMREKDILWVAYQKGSSKVPTDLNRDILHKEMEKKGFDGVSLVALDDTWSAMRFKSLS